MKRVIGRPILAVAPPACLLLGLLCLTAAGQISTPQIGFVRDLKGALRPVLGVAGAFVLGEPVLEGVLAATSSGDTAVAVTNTEVVVLKGREAIWRRPIPESSVRAVGFVSQTGYTAWVRFANGSCLVWPPRGDPKMASVCPESPSALRLTSALPEGVEGEPEALAPGWLVLRTPTRLYVARTGQDEAIYELPEVVQ